MKPYLIAELGLHGEGDLAYHRMIVEQIAEKWSGWPPLVIKTQAWETVGSPWYAAIAAATGRKPLPSLLPEHHAQLKAYCNDRGFLYAVTMHDLTSFAVEADFVKLGSFDLTQEALRDAARGSGKPVIISEGLGRFPGYPAERRMWCESKYPANASYQQGTQGYSCHSVPSLIPAHVLQAAPHCHTIEVHVTARPRHVRPLPSDMCVSLTVPQFIDLAEKVGEVWRA